MLVCLGSCDQLHSRFKDTTGQQHSCTLSFHVNTFQIIICAVVLYALFVFIRHLLYRLLWIYSISSYMYIFLKIFICVSMYFFFVRSCWTLFGNRGACVRCKRQYWFLYFIGPVHSINTLKTKKTKEQKQKTEGSSQCA